MKQNKNNLTCHLWKIPGIRIRNVGKEEINGINRESDEGNQKVQTSSYKINK